MRKPLLSLTGGILISALLLTGCFWGGDDEEPELQSGADVAAEQAAEQPSQEAAPAAAAEAQSDAAAAPADAAPADTEQAAAEAAQTEQPAQAQTQAQAEQPVQAQDQAQDQAQAEQPAPAQDQAPAQQPAAEEQAQTEAPADPPAEEQAADAEADAETETEAEVEAAPEPTLPANHLVYGSEIRSSVITPDEPAQFRFQGAEGDLVRIRVDGLATMDPVVTLLEPNRTEIRTNDDESIANRDSLLITTLPSEGLQVIRVVPYDSLGGGEFIVSVELLPAEVTDDSRILSIGESVQARLHHPGDIDTFEFAGEAGQVVRIRADGEIGADTFMEVFDPDGGFLAINDDSGHGLDAELALELAVSGRYRVDVFPAVVGRPGGERHRIGDYVFSVVLLPEPVEASGDTATALAGLALTYLDAVQTGDAVSIFGLAGPEKISQTGWKNAEDVLRDLSDEQDVVTAGALGEARAEVEGDRARVYIGVTVPGTATVLTLRVDAININGQWLVDFVERFIPIANDSGA